MIITFALQKDTGYPLATERVFHTVETVRNFMPSAWIVQLTNEDFPALNIVDEVLRYPNRGDFIDWGFGALLALCERERGENILQIATDVLIQRDVSGVFSSTFDIAATRYPPWDRTDGAFCGDVNFVKPTGVHFLSEALTTYMNSKYRDGWNGGQRAFLEASEKTTSLIKELPSHIYCRTPNRSDEDLSDAAIIHFRGNRKSWMRSYADKIMGVK